MKRYNKSRLTYKGINPMTLPNAVGKLKKDRTDEQYNEARKVLEDFSYIFQGDVFDLNEAGSTFIFNNNKITTVTPTKESKDLTSVLRRLQSDGFFDVISNKVNTKSNAINKAIDFNNKINYTEQTVNTHASIANIKQSYERLKEMKKLGAGNYLYIFDTETIGGKNLSNIWNPIGITEFSMHKVDLGTKASTATNLFLGIAPTKYNEDIYNEIVRLIKNNKTDELMKNEELRVTAMRLSLYGNKGTEYAQQDGYTIIKKFADASTEDYLNLEAIERGWNVNVDAYRTAKRTNVGLNITEKMFVDSVAEMHKAANAGTGMIAGQNFMPFDMPVVNSELKRIRQRYQDIINTGMDAYLGNNNQRVSVAQAQSAIDYIDSIFNNNVGFSIPTNQIFDTLPLFSAIRDRYGVDTLLNSNKSIIQQAGSGTARQEHVGAAWFPERFKNNMAHMADFDVSVLEDIFMREIIGPNNVTLIDYFMEQANGEGLNNVVINNKKIKANEQIFYAKKGSWRRDSQLDYTYNLKTGEVFTSSNYTINGNTPAKFNGQYNMGTNTVKGQYYTVHGIRKINTADLPSDIAQALPANSGPELYQLQLKMMVGNNTDSDLKDLIYTLHFNSEYELSGFMSSNFKNIANLEDGTWKINGDEAYDILELAHISKDGDLLRVPNLRSMSGEDLINTAATHATDRLITDRSLRYINDSGKAEQRVRSQLKLNKILANEGLDDLSKEDLSSLLSGRIVPTLGEQRSRNLTRQMIEAFNLDPNKVNGLYSNSVRNILGSRDLVNQQAPFMQTVLNALDDYSINNRITKEERAIMFNNVIEQLKINTAMLNYANSEDIRNAATNSKTFMGSIHNYKSKFEIELNSGYRLEQPKIQNVVTLNNLMANKDILSLDLSKPEASVISDLQKQLTRIKFGDRDLSSTPDRYKREALFGFVEQLSNDEMFKGYANIEDAMKYMLEDKEGFSTDYVSRKIISTMNELKNANPMAGIIRTMNVHTLTMDKDYANALNLISKDQVTEVLNRMPTVKNFTNKSEADITNYVKTNLLRHYLPSRSAFEATLEGLPAAQVDHMNVLYNILEKDMTEHLTDVLNISSKVPNANVSISKDGLISVIQGDRMISYDGIPKIKLDRNNLYTRIGSQDIGLHLDLDYDKYGKEFFTTNLGFHFSHSKNFVRNVKSSLDDGTFKLDKLVGLYSRVSKEVREQAGYTFRSGDAFINYYIGTKNVHKILPDLFGENGKLNNLGDSLDLPRELKDILRDKLKPGKKLKPGELDPILYDYLGPDYINLLRQLAQPGSVEERLLRYANTGTKDKSKFGKGIIIGGDMRFETGVMNPGENLGRPVVYGSANAYYLSAENIRNVSKKATGTTLYEGSLFESDSVERIIRKETTSAGILTTNFSSRTAYLGQDGIRSLIENNFDKIMNQNSVDYLTKEQKKNVYNSLYAFVNTFEQQKIFDAATFNKLTNGSFAADTMTLSAAKDIASIAQSATDADLPKYQRLFNLLGDITISPEGVINYKSTAGDIVKRGETIIPYAAYGGGTNNWSSKFNKGLLNFTISNKEGMKLSDEQISSILNQNKKYFEGIDVTDKKQLFKAFNEVFTSDLYNANFTVEDINKITLPKILVNESEKSMNHLLYAKIGSFDPRVAATLKAYGGEAAELIGTAVPTIQALEAHFKNQGLMNTALKAGKFSSWEEFVEAVDIESLLMNNMLFGQNGLLPGVTDIGNDNIPGHGNKASMMIGAIDEAVAMLGKHLGTGIESNENRLIGLQKFVEIYNRPGNQIYTNSKGEAIKLSTRDGHLYLDGGRSLNESLNNADLINAKALDKVFADINEELKQAKAPLSDMFVHTTKDGETIVGRMIYSNGSIIASSGIGSKKIVIDSETQSSMPQEFVDAKMKIMELKEKRQILENELKRDPSDIASAMQLESLEYEINNLNEYIGNMNETGHLMRIGDQERNIIKNYSIKTSNYKSIEKQIADGTISEDVLKANESLRGINKSKYTDYKTFGFIEKELKEQMFYNPYEENKLTEEMLRGRYAHLKGVYGDIVGLGLAPALGVDTAEKINDLRMTEAAVRFNYGYMSKNELDDLGFDIMTPEQYVNNFGDPNASTYESMVKKNVILDMGEEFGANRYVAVPGMGSILEDGEIKQDWHKKTGALINTYNKELVPLRGSKEGRAEIIEKMGGMIDDIKESSAGYLKKGTIAHKMVRPEIYAATDRAKILTTMNTENNPLLQKAMADGRSLADWAKDGVYYDYSFDSIEAFEKRGLIPKEGEYYMGKSRAEMIEYLQTHGTVMLDDRYPNIKDTSIVPVRHYLNPNFQANNAALIAPHTALKLNADSDGDSISRFLVKYKNEGYTAYGIARQAALEDIKGMSFSDDESREAAIRTAAISKGISADAYDEFRGVDIQMAIDAVDTNKNWQARVIDVWEDDKKKTLIMQSIRTGDKLSQAEVPGGKSILGEVKLLALKEDPTEKVVRDNIDSVNNMLKIVQGHADILDKEEFGSILNGPSDILEYDGSGGLLKESEAIDKMLTAMEQLSKTPGSNVSEDLFKRMQGEGVKRVRINAYHSEAMSKLGITATGNVNATLYGISQATKNYYGVIGSEHYDQLRRDVVSKMADEMEQAPISSKKIEVKRGDTRLLTFTDIFNNIKGQGMNDDNKADLEQWMREYMDQGKIVKAYQNLVTSSGIENPLTDKNEITTFMIDNFISTVDTALDKSGPMRHEVNYWSRLGRRSANPRAIMDAQGRVSEESFGGLLSAAISGVRSDKPLPEAFKTKTTQEMAEIAYNDAVEQIDSSAAQKLAQTATEAGSNIIKKLSSGSGLGKSLALGVVGLSAGLIASGYASGNPLNDPDPKSIAQDNHGNSIMPNMSFGGGINTMAANNTGGYIINIKGDTNKGNRQLKKALKKATGRYSGSSRINMNIKTTNSNGAYSDNDIENILNNYF